MKQLIRNLRIMSLAIFLIFIALFAGVLLQQNRASKMLSGHEGENKLSLQGSYAQAGTIFDRHGYPLAFSQEGKRYYAEDDFLASALVQVIGDYTHNIANTIEERYQAELTGIDRGGLKQFLYDLTGRGDKGSNLRLSLDAQISGKAAELLAGYSGAIVILNYKTGDILSVVNAPFVSPENVVEWKDIPEGALFNKAFLAQYMPGSTFKVITDSAWISSPAFDPDYIHPCSGTSPLLGPGSVLENRADAGHGYVNREDALAVSCNHYFGQVAIFSGGKALLDKAEHFAFNQEINLDKIFVKSSKLQMDPQISDHVLSWLAIGQALEGQELTVTPLHLALISGAIANNGVMLPPRLVLERQEPGEDFREYPLNAVPLICGKSEEMAILANDMIHSVQVGMARSAQIPGWRIGGKTGTAQISDEEGKLSNNSLFTGFMQSDKHPIAIAIVLEDASVDISAIAGEIFRFIIDEQSVQD